jgi:hypothetical protein
MTKIVNFCFIFLFVLGLATSKNLLKSSSGSNSLAGSSTCWAYATNDDMYLKGVFPNNVGYTNKQTGVKKNIIYSNVKETCKKLCKRNRKGYDCYGAYSYDRDFGIPKDSYICWNSVPCARHFNKTEYNTIDTSISHSSKKRCNHLCDSIYGQEGLCRQRPQTEQEKIDKKKDENYYCFYRGPQFAFKATDLLGRIETIPQNYTETSNVKVNVTKF